jgi:hypothetical protein
MADRCASTREEGRLGGCLAALIAKTKLAEAMKQAKAAFSKAAPTWASEIAPTR